MRCCAPALDRGRDGFAFDPEAGVPLACVTIAYRCGDPYVAAVVDSVGPRRLTRPNDVLFDLIRGCDLTRIKDVGWRKFLATPDDKVAFEDYSAMFVGGRAGNPDAAAGRHPILGALLRAGPDRLASPHAIAITLLHWDSDDAVRLMRRMPVTGIKVAPTCRAIRPAAPAPSSRSSTAITGSRRFSAPPAPMTNAKARSSRSACRGGLVVDANGQLVAAGGGYLETRPGWPGSDFISAFTVTAPSRRAAAPVRRKAK